MTKYLFCSYQNWDMTTEIFCISQNICCCVICKIMSCHDDVIKWKHFPHYWQFVRGIHLSSVNFPHKGRWCRALTFSLIFAWINCWVNNREAANLRGRHAHHDITVMSWPLIGLQQWEFFFKLNCNKKQLLVEGAHRMLSIHFNWK